MESGWTGATLQSRLPCIAVVLQRAIVLGDDQPRSGEVVDTQTPP